MKYTRAVTNNKFPDIRYFLKKSHIEVDTSDRNERLLNYSSGQKLEIPSTEYIEGYAYTAKKNVADDLSFSNYIELCNSLYKKLSGTSNQDEINSFTLRYYWGLRLEIFFYKQNVEEFIRGERDFVNTGLSLDSIVFLIAHLFILDWERESYQLTKDLFEIINIKFDVVSGVENQERPSDAQYFVLNFLNRQQGWNIPCVIEFEPTDDVYKKIIEDWSLEGCHTLEELFIDACNRHINEAKFFEEDKRFQKYYDFGKYEFFYYPFEVLIVEKSREKNNLNTIKADHFLLKTPLGVLPSSSKSDNYYNDFLVNLLIRVKSEYPDFAEDYKLPKSTEPKKNSWKFW